MGIRYRWSYMEKRIRLIGFKTVNLDEKGRIIIPTAFTESIHTGNFVMVPGFNTVLHLYPEESFKRLENKIESLESEEDKKYITDFIYSNSVEIKADSQWRINIPDHLLSYAKIKESVKIVGGNDKLDIWNTELHEKYNDSLRTLGESSFKKVGL